VCEGYGVDIDWGAELLDQLEAHWRHQLRPRLDGLTDDEYFWEPVPGCWSLTEGAKGEFTMDYAPPPRAREPVTTIAWRMAHLGAVFGRPDAPHFEGSRAGHRINFAGTAEAALRQLDEGYEAWVRDVLELGTAGLARPQGSLSPPEFADAPMAKLVMHVHREVIHHGAEVCLLRDLWGAMPQVRTRTRTTKLSGGSARK
jgi:hypothetical protein